MKTLGKKLQLGAVSYLNTKPLIEGLAELAPYANLQLDYPSRLADRLARGELDVALIPSVEYFQNPAYRIISDACIGCRGPVLSVKLFSRVPMDQIRTLALDEGSRTSAALTKILLWQRFGIRPRLQPLPVMAGLADADTDAVLLIGDRAIFSPSGKFAEVWDLGDEWCRWAELPFVFAMWVARPEIDTTEITTALELARDRGVAQLGQIALREAATLGMTVPQCHSYLRDNLYFYLGPREARGLALFYQHAQALGLAPAGVNLVRHDYETVG
ncbi:MAG: menaquinone biosynthesis protein [Pirellulales bacterium]|nr:menaquinone biosynthesis protein [Pirellulales bacterium]